MAETLSSAISVDALGKGWKTHLNDVFQSPSMNRLKAFLRREIESGRVVFPALDASLRALRMVDFPDVRVVILGQDPYHGEGQANGLAFAVHQGVKLPPSLKNIFKELQADLGGNPQMGTTLEGWAQQGVLLLNTVLTVRADEAFSHRGQGWEEFTESVVRVLNDRDSPIVFMLWGASAHKKEAIITNPLHLVLKAAHPSPLSAHRGFLGCRHFSLANEFLRRNGRVIDWLKMDRFEY